MKSAEWYAGCDRSQILREILIQIQEVTAQSMHLIVSNGGTHTYANMKLNYSLGLQASENCVFTCAMLATFSVQYKGLVANRMYNYQYPTFPLSIQSCLHSTACNVQMSLIQSHNTNAQSFI